MSSRTRNLVAAAVVGSMALNVILLLSRGETWHEPLSLEAQQRSSLRETACHADLDQCQQKRWAQALKTLTLSLSQAAPRSACPPPDDRAVEPSPAPPGATDRVRQQAALCAVAREHLRQEWTAQGKDLSRVLREGLADDDALERGMRQEVDRFGDTLKLTPEDRKRLEAHYRPLRQQRAAEALKALNDDPPDYTTVRKTAASLIVDQDRLVKELFGSDSLEQLRRSEIRSRTVMLALVAAQAGLDWDASIEW